MPRGDVTGPEKSTLKVDAAVAASLRRLAGYEGQRLSLMLERLLRYYIEREQPKLVGLVPKRAAR